MLMGQSKLPELETCLSPYVHQLVIEKSHSQHRDPKVLDGNGLLDFNYICSKLPAEGSEEDQTTYFTACVTIMAPMLHSVEDFMTEGDIDLREGYSHFLHWTGQSERLLELWDMKKHRDDIADLTVLLVTTAILERSLGNVYLLEGPEPCPSMLKDLLVSTHLRNILGSNVLQVLRILIGPPTSLNIRNIAWHGFPYPGEIPRRCIWFIILLVPSIGQILVNKHITEIKCREPVCFPEVQLISESKVFLQDDWITKLANTELVFWNAASFWKKIKHFYTQKRYSYCAALLLFYLEQSLRLVFATVNKCENRILTAEATTLYTTFDEILDFRLPDSSENKLIHCISPNLIEILLDHLQYQYGPRVRDRLSHGEACWDSFPWTLTDNLATVAMALSAMFVPRREEKQNDSERTIFNSISMYKVQFHRIAVLKKQILASCIQATEIDDLIIFLPDLTERQSGFEYPVCDSHVEISGIMQQSCTPLMENWSHAHLQTDCVNWYTACLEFKCKLEMVLQAEIDTLYREHKLQVSAEKEAEILTFLEHILAECQKVLSNLQEFITTRQAQLASKQLRSRQRDDFKKFLHSMSDDIDVLADLNLHMSQMCKKIQGFPSYVSAVNMCCYLGCWQLYHLESLNCHTCFSPKLKFWKKTLQFCENLRTCSQNDKNKWTEGLELITQYMTTLKSNIVTQLICKHSTGDT